MSAYEARGESDEWYTPRYIFDSLGERFDMDVSAPANGPRHVPCDAWLSKEHDALSREWRGFVWMNPPFGHQRTKMEWLQKFFSHGNGIALMPDRTSAPWWQFYAYEADAILFVAGKIKFERPDGSVGESPGTGTCLLAKGKRAVEALKRSGLGIVMTQEPRP